MNINKLKMNASKTKYMIIRSIRKELRGNTILKCLDRIEIERVEIMKYLGIIIDDRLQFQDHCNYMLKKIFFNVYVLYTRVFQLMSCKESQSMKRKNL